MKHYFHVLLILLLGACAKPPVIEEPSVNNYCSEGLRNLEGTWTSACNPALYSGSTPIKWYRTSVSINSTAFTEVLKVFGNSDCAGAEQQILNASATYVVGSQVAHDYLYRYQFDFTVTSASSNIGSSIPAVGANLKRVIGLAFSSGYSGLVSCSGSPLNTMLFTGTMFYTSGFVLGGDAVYPTATSTVVLRK